MDNALDDFKKTADFNLPPAQLADRLRDYLSDYWKDSPNKTFCFHLCGYYQGQPFFTRRFNPLPPSRLIEEAHHMVEPYTVCIDGADNESIAQALVGIRAPRFAKIPPVQTLNHLVDIVSIVIDNVDCCGGDIQTQIILPDRVVDFKATRNSVLARTLQA
ncbi:MAG: hypothetical protein A4E53_03864 [Pelotomaculum sp. PtaB.Bin104]|nr:MAG: hypothetical protein A4E53_03864 [Pelotomaculum sp. PtaB.Bin104]